MESPTNRLASDTWGWRNDKWGHPSGFFNWIKGTILKDRKCSHLGGGNSNMFFIVFHSCLGKSSYLKSMIFQMWVVAQPPTSHLLQVLHGFWQWVLTVASGAVATSFGNNKDRSWHSFWWIFIGSEHGGFTHHRNKPDCVFHWGRFICLGKWHHWMNPKNKYTYIYIYRERERDTWFERSW